MMSSLRRLERWRGLFRAAFVLIHVCRKFGFDFFLILAATGFSANLLAYMYDHFLRNHFTRNLLETPHRILFMREQITIWAWYIHYT